MKKINLLLPIALATVPLAAHAAPALTSLLPNVAHAAPLVQPLSEGTANGLIIETTTGYFEYLEYGPYGWSVQSQLPGNPAVNGKGLATVVSSADNGYYVFEIE